MRRRSGRNAAAASRCAGTAARSGPWRAEDRPGDVSRRGGDHDLRSAGREVLAEVGERPRDYRWGHPEHARHDAHLPVVGLPLGLRQRPREALGDRE
jgi:hypothetical protein